MSQAKIYNFAIKNINIIVERPFWQRKDYFLWKKGGGGSLRPVFAQFRFGPENLRKFLQYPLTIRSQLHPHTPYSPREPLKKLKLHRFYAVFLKKKTNKKNPEKYIWVIPYQIYNQNFDSPENFFPRSREEKKWHVFFFSIWYVNFSSYWFFYFQSAKNVFFNTASNIQRRV